MFKMGSHDPFGHLKHKLWPKEMPIVKLPIKVGNHLDFLTCRWLVTYRWKALDEGYNLALDLISNGGLHAKLWARKVAGALVMRILGLSLGSPKTKCHLDVGLTQRHIIYYKGEGGGFPQVWAVVNLMNLNLLVIRPSTKSAPTMH